MKKILFATLTIFFMHQTFGQEDWQLPKVNGKIQFEFNSKQLSTGNSNLCEIYTSAHSNSEMAKKIQALSTNGSIKFWSASTWSLAYVPWGADVSGTTGVKFCTPAESDTLIGSLNLFISQTNILASTRSGSVKCIYRIILNKNDYNIKFRGFEYTYYTKATMIKPSEMVVVNLEEEYDEENATKSDRAYWADIKVLVTWFHTTLEEVLGEHSSDFNFDD